MKKIKSMSFATIFVITFVTAITIFAELSEGFKNILKSITGHHWITKSVFSFILFFGIYFFSKFSDEKIDILKEVRKIIRITLLCSLALFFFFLWHYLNR